MDREESVDDILKEYGEHNGRLKALADEMGGVIDDLRRIEADATRIVGTVKEASDAGEKEALLSEVDEKIRRGREVSEEAERLAAAVDKLGKERAGIEARLDAGMENVREAALETEKMMFELGKLVATLDVAAIVAVSAVTPALLPRLDGLGGLWPALSWLLVSIAVSVAMCFYSIMNVSQLVARGSARRGGPKRPRRLPEKLSWIVASLPYAFLLTFSAGALLIGVALFALFVSANIG